MGEEHNPIKTEIWRACAYREGSSQGVLNWWIIIILQLVPVDAIESCAL